MSSFPDATAASRANDRARADDASKVLQFPGPDRPVGVQRQGPFDLRKTFDQQAIARRLSRRLKRYFTPSEFSVLDHILDQTASMGRAEWGFTYWKMEHGDSMTGGTGLSKRHLVRIVKVLRACGAIATRSTGKGLVIAPILDWQPPEAMQKASERRKRRSQNVARPPETRAQEMPSMAPHEPHEVPSMAPHEVPSMSPIREEAGKREAQEGKSEAPPFADARDTVPTARYRSRPIASALPASPALAASPPSPPVAPAPPPMKERPADLKPGSFEKTWRTAWEKTFAGRLNAIVRPWTKAQLGMVTKALIGGWMGKPQELHEYLAWAVEQWEWIIPTAFAWMTRSPPPALPDIGFFVAQEAKFRGLYNTKTRDEWIKSARSPEERMFLELTSKKGMTAEEARIEIATRKAQATMRDELAKQRAAIANETAVLREQERRLSRLQRPQAPHPSSVAAREQRLKEAFPEKVEFDPSLGFDFGPFREEDELASLQPGSNSNLSSGEHVLTKTLQ